MKLLIALFSFLLSCYIQDVKGQARLIGVPTEPSNPNSVAVIFDRYSENICSGAVIHSHWIATTADCAARSFIEERRVQIGNKVTLDFNTAAHIKTVHIHQGYDGFTRENDIALIELVSPFSTSIRTLKISDDSGCALAGRKAYALGFGDNGASSADGTLRQYKVSILDNYVCAQYPVFMNENKLCTYESRACEGDQGGPLVSEDKKILLGLISVTDDLKAMCGGDKIIPITTYTRVSEFVDWIRNITQIYYL